MDCFKFKRSVVISRVTTKKLTLKMQRKKWEKNQNDTLQKNQTPERAVVEELKDKKDVTYVKQIAKWRNIFFLISTLNKWSSPIKIELILEKKSKYMLSLEIQRYKQIENEKWKKLLHANRNQRRVRLDILISHKKTH